MSITRSNRTKFTGAHLSPETKAAVQKVARKGRKSVSKFVSEAVEEKLERETLIESVALPETSQTTTVGSTIVVEPAK